MIIRRATDGDSEAIRAIYAHAVEHGTASFETVVPDDAEMGSRLNAVHERGLPWIVAEEANRVVGYAYAGPYRARYAYRFTAEVSIYVAPDQQRRGIGKALFEQLIDRCRQAGVKQLVAVIGDSGNEGSIALHRACGFRHVGTLQNVGFKFDRWLDTVLMQRGLDD